MPREVRNIDWTTNNEARRAYHKAYMERRRQAIKNGEIVGKKRHKPQAVDTKDCGYRYVGQAEGVYNACPDEVLAERERAYDPKILRTLTAVLCGDPLPGRSALDREHT